MAAVAGGMGLIGVAVVAGALYYSGYGGKMIDQLQGLERGCYGALSSVGPSISGPVCQGLAYAVNGVTHASEAVGDVFRRVGEQLHGQNIHYSGVGALGTDFLSSIGSLGSAPDRLSQLMVHGPVQGIGADTSQRFQRSIDSFSIGQHYLNSHHTTEAVPWLMQGAQQPDGFGLLSQLSLGDLYLKGGSGLAPDPIRAQVFYQQAANSLTQLSRSDSPQAQRLLATLPASPQTMQQSILEKVEYIKERRQ